MTDVTYPVVDMTEWLDACAYAQAQAEIEDAATTILWAIIISFSAALAGTLVAALVTA